MLVRSIERMTRGLSNLENFVLVEETASFLSEIDTAFFLREGDVDPSDSDPRAITAGLLEKQTPSRESKYWGNISFYEFFPYDV